MLAAFGEVFLLYGQQCRGDEQGQECRETQTIDDGGGQRHPPIGAGATKLNGAVKEVDVEFIHQRQQPKDGGPCREQHRAHALNAGADDGVHGLEACIEQVVECVDEHDVVVHHDAGQRHDACSGHDDREGLPLYQHAEQCAKG